jgi:mRNA interferase HigB
MAKSHIVFSVNVIAKSRLRIFWTKHPEAQAPSMVWFKHMRRTRYENINEVRLRFPQADLVGVYTVFNIGGNKYRLIVKIIYTSQRVYVDQILTHDEWTEQMRKKKKR